MLFYFVDQESFIDPDFLFDTIFSMHGVMNRELVFFEFYVSLSVLAVLQDFTGLIDMHVAILD